MRRLMAVPLAAGVAGFAVSVLEIKGKQNKALLRFDLSGLPARATMMEARSGLAAGSM